MADLVEVDAEKFERDTDVVAEGECFDHVDDVGAVVDVLFAQMLQDADLLLRLSMKPFLVTDDLERHVNVVPVIFGLNHLTEASSSETLRFNQRENCSVKHIGVGAQSTLGEARHFCPKIFYV